MNEPAGYLAQQLETKSVSGEYQESQKASRGARNITQTTIEQQWDVHLINDAEFTARIRRYRRLLLMSIIIK